MGAIPLLVGVSFFIFVLIELSPQDPAQHIAGENASAEVVARIRAELGLDEPLPSRYADWAQRAVRGDLGESLITGEPVTTRIARALPETASLVASSMLLAVVVGGAAGLLAGMRPNGRLDRALGTLTSAALSLPAFWLALLLVLVFAVELGWLPAVGYVPVQDGIFEWLEHLVLPAVALSAITGAEISRQLRSSLLDVLDEHYVLAARARGIPARRVVCRHALKNALGPVLTITGYRLAQLIGGTVVVERVFGYRGMGKLSVDAATQGDLPIILGVTVVTLLVVMAVNVIVDLSYGFVNPRVRSAAP